MVEWRMIHKSVTSSTNDDAAKGVHGDVFTADFQTAGRGRGDHVWEGEKSAALMMSAVLDAGACRPEYVATLPLVAGLAVMKGVSRFPVKDRSAAIGVKWPNDVLVGGRKIAGILCCREADRVIVGIGVNVRQKSFLGELAGKAVSLAMLGVDAFVSDVRNAVLEELSSLYEEWISHGAAGNGELPHGISAMLAVADLLKGRRIRVVRTDGDRRPVEGVAGGFAPDGALLVDGAKIYSGEAVEAMPSHGLSENML